MLSNLQAGKELSWHFPFGSGSGSCDASEDRKAASCLPLKSLIPSLQSMEVDGLRVRDTNIDKERLGVYKIRLTCEGDILRALQKIHEERHVMNIQLFVIKEIV